MAHGVAPSSMRSTLPHTMALSVFWPVDQLQFSLNVYHYLQYMQRVEMLELGLLGTLQAGQ